MTERYMIIALAMVPAMVLASTAVALFRGEISAYLRSNSFRRLIAEYACVVIWTLLSYKLGRKMGLSAEVILLVMSLGTIVISIFVKRWRTNRRDRPTMGRAYK